VQRRSAPAITTTRRIWRSFLGRVQDIHQRSYRREKQSSRSPIRWRHECRITLSSLSSTLRSNEAN
jgi:hypothetical protein